jgi:hypothetical protein
MQAQYTRFPGAGSRQRTRRHDYAQAPRRNTQAAPLRETPGKEARLRSPFPPFKQQPLDRIDDWNAYISRGWLLLFTMEKQKRYRVHVDPVPAKEVYSPTLLCLI